VGRAVALLDAAVLLGRLNDLGVNGLGQVDRDHVVLGDGTRARVGIVGAGRHCVLVCFRELSERRDGQGGG
jgi:hypothetical protein